MNGIHDMGGMHGMGLIVYETDEPVFHAAWEGRVYALTLALWLGASKPNIDLGRHDLEQLLPPADYLGMSYYERWAARLSSKILKVGLATPAEIESGRPAPGSPKGTPQLTAEMVPTLISRGVPARRDAKGRPRFRVGQRVRARNIHPTGHTRLPRYARGKRGAIAQDRGVFVFPDTNAHALGENPQHLYSVRFAARELWGERASSRDAVYLDLWEDYLERP